MKPISMIGALSHELGHNIYENNALKVPFSKFLGKIYTDTNQYFATTERAKNTFNEFVADVFSVICLDKYLELFASGLTLDQKVKIIEDWILVNCTPSSSSVISSGHPAHSFRVNTLLVSKRVYKIMCEKLSKK